MPQAKLPDINHAWVFYRHTGINAVQMKNYPLMVSSVQETNALLPDDYRVEVNTEKYNQLIKDNTDVVCTECKAEVNLSDIRIVKLLLNPYDRLVYNDEFEESWICPKEECNKINRLTTTRIIKSQLAKPHYFKVIPEPPRRKEGIGDRTLFHNLMVQWYYLALEELDYQLGKYRHEYTTTDSAEQSIIGDQELDYAD